MKILEEIKSKVKEFLTYIENSNDIKSDDAINKFKELFEDGYITDYSYINQAYFQSETRNYYIKNGLGLTLQVNSGDWDRYGYNVSHVGKDVVIYSNFSKYREFRDGVVLFFEDEKKTNNLLENIEKMLDIDLSSESLLVNARNNKEQNSIYKILPNSVKDKDELVFERYMSLKKAAEKKHRDDIEYENISPYRRIRC